MSRFLKSLLGFSFFSTLLISPFIYGISSHVSPQILRCEGVFQKHTALTSQEQKPLEILDESKNETANSTARKRKKMDVTSEKSLLSQVHNQYIAMKEKNHKHQLQLKNLEEELSRLLESFDEDVQNEVLDKEIETMYAKIHSTESLIEQVEKELFKFTKEALEAYGFKVIAREKPDPEFAKVTVFLNELIQANGALDRSLKKLNDLMNDPELDSLRKRSMKMIFEDSIHENRQRLNQTASSNKNNPAYNEAVELYDIYKNGDGEMSPEGLRKVLLRVSEPHLEIVEFPNGSAASSMQKKLHLKVIVTPKFEVKNSARVKTLGSHFRLHDFSFVWLNLEDMLEFPVSELFVYGTLLHEAGHASHSLRRSTGTGTDLDLELFSRDNTSLLGASDVYSKYMNLEEVFTWVKDVQYLTSNYVMEKSKDNRGLQKAIQEKLNEKREISKRMIEVSLQSLQGARKSIQDGVKLQRIKAMKKYYEYSIPLEIDGALRSLRIQVQGKPASEPHQQNEIFLDSIRRAELRVKLLQRQLEGNQKDIMPQDDLDQHNRTLDFLLRELGFIK